MIMEFEVEEKHTVSERSECKKEVLDKECLKCAFGYDDDEGIYCMRHR